MPSFWGLPNQGLGELILTEIVGLFYNTRGALNRHSPTGQFAVYFPSACMAFTRPTKFSKAISRNVDHYLSVSMSTAVKWVTRNTVKGLDVPK